MARQERNLQLLNIAKKLNIRAAYLEALELGDRQKLPKGVYARNFLREYARFLGLDYKDLQKQFEIEDKSRPAPVAPFERQIVAKRHLIAVPVVVRNTLIGLAALFCLIYLGFLVKQIFEPPPLVLEQPVNDITTQDRSLQIKGRTDPETDVRINNETVQVSSDGMFVKEVYLERGLNTVTITASKKYSRETSLIRHILFEETPPSLNSTN